MRPSPPAPALAAGLAALLAACAVHVHVHEAPAGGEPTVAARPDPVGAAAADDARSERHERGLSGVVVDASGRPTRARVAVVGPSGSMSTSTGDDGGFAFDESPWPDPVLHASTADGRVAVRSVEAGSRGLRLRLGPGAGVDVTLGEAKARVALFHGDLRIEDFTVREGETASSIVPAGPLRICVYRGDEVLAERSVELGAGERRRVAFDLGT